MKSPKSVKFTKIGRCHFLFPIVGTGLAIRRVAKRLTDADYIRLADVTETLITLKLDFPNLSVLQSQERLDGQIAKLAVILSHFEPMKDSKNSSLPSGKQIGGARKALRVG